MLGSATSGEREPREKGQRKTKKTAPRARAKPSPVKRSPEEEGARIQRRNVLLFLVALAVIVAGFIALALRSITLAPILLVAGYLVLLPWAIIAHGRQGKKQENGAPAGPGTS
jgi:Flp pilus assembly protein TadB